MMMKLNSIEEYQNLIVLLKEALKFYADSRNYNSYMGNPASIDLDERGSQARFALQKIKELEDEYNKEISELQNKK